MISTGMAGIDEMLGGGIPRGSKVLYSMEPGVNGQLFMISTIYDALAKDRSCLIILPHTTVDAFLHDAANMRGTMLPTIEKKIAFIDMIDRERIQRSAPTREAQEKEWRARINKLCKENQTEVIFGYFDVIYEDFGLERGFVLLDSCHSEHSPTIVIEHLNLEGDSLPEQFVRKLSFDLVVSIKASFGLLPHFNFFTVVHTSKAPMQKRSVPFIISKGQIVPYIPKIIVIGPPESGKSTFVASASERVSSIDRPGLSGDMTTVAMDIGWMHWKDFDITLYGTLGQPRFDLLMPMLLKNAMGAVMVIDVTKPETLPQAKDLIILLSKQHMPLVIAANKNDLPGAMSESEIRNGLNLKANIPVFFISAQRNSDVRFVLESLVDFITQFSY
jgi:signal recognition particle receptor subunit beta